MNTKPRADSRRNSSSVPQAARTVFAADGIDAPLEAAPARESPQAWPRTPSR